MRTREELPTFVGRTIENNKNDTIQSSIPLSEWRRRIKLLLLTVDTHTYMRKCDEIIRHVTRNTCVIRTHSPLCTTKANKSIVWIIEYIYMYVYCLYKTSLLQII